ncbi:phage regulatory CII family protein [Methylosinus sp. Ce-a6]|uniref:phage regulatory CII family protein n=1 Tax=Methylosinus sp. Ce-a6 TaxID=2172005 RepID=UPI00135A5BEB|nr:phage regulatory CII family protein [Methylosinus sp. Ce-a6]
MTKQRDYGTTKDIVTRLVDEAGGVKRSAFLLERAVSRLYELCDPASPDHMSYDFVRKLTEFCGATAAAEDLAALAGGVFMPIEIGDGDLPHIAADKAHEHGRVTTQLFVAMGDGDVSASEARDLLKQVDDELRALMAMRAKLASLSKG